MLTTNLAKANNKLNKMKLLGGGGGSGGSGDRGGGTGRGNGDHGAEKGSGGGNDAAISYLRMLTKTADTILHPTKDWDMKWCKFCGPVHTKGTPAGMCMQAPHDHAKWLLTKKEKLAKFNAKKKSLKAKNLKPVMTPFPPTTLSSISI